MVHISNWANYPNPQPALNNSPKHCDILCSRSALECCQEAAAILEWLADTAANTDDNKNHLSLVQDRLAAAYLWQALLEHKATMEDKPEAKSAEELSESYDTEEVLVHKFFFFRGNANLAPVVQKVDNALYWINHYPVDSTIVCYLFPLTGYSDLYGEQPYPTFEQPGPEIHGNGPGVVRCGTVYPLLPLLVPFFSFVI